MLRHLPLRVMFVTEILVDLYAGRHGDPLQRLFPATANTSEQSELVFVDGQQLTH